MKYAFKLTFFIIISTFLFSGCKKKKAKLIIFHAGSLSIPFKRIAKEFEKENSSVKVELEASGSRICARKISELGRKADIMASADYSVIDNLLIPDYASWNIKFATNEMVIVFTNKSKYKEKISSDNWYQILTKPDVVYGRSDPNSDPCGYRTVFVAKLAEGFYKNPGFSKRLLKKDKKAIRPKETDLLALLETGDIDYLFIYRSVALQHKLKFISLPDEINLKSNKLSALYNKVSVKISGKKPGKFITKKGAPMVYGVTIVKNAPHKELAEKFIRFLMDKNKGLKIMEESGQKAIYSDPKSLPAFMQ